MILILFLCIKLSIFHLCVSELGYECRLDETRNDPEIWLIAGYKSVETITITAHFRKNLNYEFKNFCGDYYNINIGFLEDVENYTNVVQFAVPNYHDGMPLGNFEYAGNISKIDDAVCKNKSECYEIANLVTPTVKDINDGHVYDIVQEMQLIWNNNFLTITHRSSCEPHFQNTSYLTIVLLCYRWNRFSEDKKPVKQVNILPLTLIQVPEEDCPSYLDKTLISLPSHLNRLLAVLAPKPFKLPSEYSVPTIFYETPYLNSEDKADFPKSMNLVPWRLLKYGFVKFIQKVGWQRVAIVTDDSEYSLDFEDELTALFSKERLVYTVIRCEDTKCNMNKIAKELSRVSARIVIANVNEKHAKDLLRHTAGAITCLFRDMAGRVTTEEMIPNAFSFSLHSTNDKGCNGVDDNILTGLSSISHAYRTLTNKDYNVKRRQFYSLFAERVKQVTPKITEAKIFVHTLRNQVVASMHADENGANILEYHDPYGAGKPTDGTAHCLVSTFNFHVPCEDPLVMFLMFVFMMFVLTALLISCFFDKTSPFNDIRYQNF